MLRHDVTGGLPADRKLGRSFDALLPKLAERIREVTKYAEQKGIRTMSENHGFFAQDSDRIEKLINAVGHPNYGALIDCGNFLCADEEPTHGVGVLAPYAFHVHAKDFLRKSGMETDPGEGWFRSRGGNYLRGTVIGHGEAHIAQSVGILKRAGYDGYVTVEFEGMEDNLTASASAEKICSASWSRPDAEPRFIRSGKGNTAGLPPESSRMHKNPRRMQLIRRGFPALMKPYAVARLCKCSIFSTSASIS